MDEADFGASFLVHYDIDGVDFSSEHFDREREKRNAFLSYLEKSWDVCRKYCDRVNTFFLQMMVENACAASLVKKWIDFTFTNKVKTLQISLKKTYGLRFHLHNIASIAATLVELEIEQCHISNCSFMLPTLRSLFNDDFKDRTVKNIFLFKKIS